MKMLTAICLLFVGLSASASQIAVVVSPGTKTQLQLDQTFKAGDSIGISCTGSSEVIYYYCGTSGDLRVRSGDQDSLIAIYNNVDKCIAMAAKANASRN